MIELRLFRGSCGDAAGADQLWPLLTQAAQESNQQYCLKAVGCVGLCYLEPLLAVRENLNEARMLPGSVMDDDFEHPLLLYGKVKPEDVASI